MIGLLMMLAAQQAGVNLKDQTYTSWAFGMGNVSCATAWEPRNDSASQEWVLGFWSGLNYLGEPMVGSKSDRAGVIGEVKLVCAQAPSEKLMLATMAAYRKMKASRR